MGFLHRPGISMPLRRRRMCMHKICRPIEVFMCRQDAGGTTRSETLRLHYFYCRRCRVRQVFMCTLKKAKRRIPAVTLRFFAALRMTRFFAGVYSRRDFAYSLDPRLRGDDTPRDFAALSLAAEDEPAGIFHGQDARATFFAHGQDARATFHSMSSLPTLRARSGLSRLICNAMPISTRTFQPAHR